MKLWVFNRLSCYSLRPAGRPEPAVSQPASARARKSSARSYLSEKRESRICLPFASPRKRRGGGGENCHCAPIKRGEVWCAWRLLLRACLKKTGGKSHIPKKYLILQGFCLDTKNATFWTMEGSLYRKFLFLSKKQSDKMLKNEMQVFFIIQSRKKKVSLNFVLNIF